MSRLAHVLAAILALALATAGSAAAGPLSGAAIIDRLNGERAQLGLYDNVQQVPAWSAKCGLHNRWMRLNNRLQHPEIKGTRGYSRGGNWAGTSSVLARGNGWRAGNPWRNAPIHLTQAFHPDLRQAGASDAFGHSCLTTWPGMDDTDSVKPIGAPLDDHFWTLPKHGGRIFPAQRAAEGPFTPQEKVGIRAGALTGPYLYVWATTDRLSEEDMQQVPDPTTGEMVWPEGALHMPLAIIERGSLIGPNGDAVATKVIDDGDVGGLAGLGNGWLLPIRPLKPRTAYRATVVLGTGPVEPGFGDARQVTHTWTFTTTRR